MTKQVVSHSLDDTIALGKHLGALLRGGEVIELVSDLGGGKTQLVRGLAEGIASKDAVQSPSFTISRIYRGKGLELHHFDFHRLSEPGIIRHELAEVIGQPKIVVAIEWADSVQDILPTDRLTVRIESSGETERAIELEANEPRHTQLLEAL